MKRKAARTPCAQGGPRWCPCWVHSKPIKARPEQLFWALQLCEHSRDPVRQTGAGGGCGQGCAGRAGGAGMQAQPPRPSGARREHPWFHGAAGKQSSTALYKSTGEWNSFPLGTGARRALPLKQEQQQGSLQPWMRRSTSTAKPQALWLKTRALLCVMLSNCYGWKCWDKEVKKLIFMKNFFPAAFMLENILAFM